VEVTVVVIEAVSDEVVEDAVEVEEGEEDEDKPKARSGSPSPSWEDWSRI